MKSRPAVNDVVGVLLLLLAPSADLWQQTCRHVFGLTTAPDRCRIFASGDDSLPSDDRI